MAARVTAAEVKAIMENCNTLDATVDTFIASGTLFIDSVFASSLLGDDVLKEIERWFVAHMLASTVFRTASQEKVGDAEIKYTGVWGKELESTPYGQMCLILDTSGALKKVGKRPISIKAIINFDE